MLHSDSAPQNCTNNANSSQQNSGTNQNDGAWQKNAASEKPHDKQKVSVFILIGRAISFLVKWVWLMTMFSLGIGLCVLIQSKIFEYSYSLSELDLIETLFVIGLAMFAFHYLKICSRSDVPLVRKIITPFVHQAQVFLVTFVGLVIYAKANNQGLEDYANVPLLDLVRHVLILMTLGYSYYWIADTAGEKIVVAEACTDKAVDKPTDLHQNNQKGYEAVKQGAAVNPGGAE